MEKKKIEVDYKTCGFCIEYDCDNCYCMARGEFEIYPGDTCDGFTPEPEPFLTDEEFEAQRTDAAERENHRKDVEGEIE